MISYGRNEHSIAPRRPSERLGTDPRGPGNTQQQVPRRTTRACTHRCAQLAREDHATCSVKQENK